MAPVKAAPLPPCHCPCPFGTVAVAMQSTWGMRRTTGEFSATTSWVACERVTTLLLFLLLLLLLLLLVELLLLLLLLVLLLLLGLRNATRPRCIWSSVSGWVMRWRCTKIQGAMQPKVCLSPPSISYAFVSSPFPPPLPSSRLSPFAFGSLSALIWPAVSDCQRVELGSGDGRRWRL